jgi:hypothetical protein
VGNCSDRMRRKYIYAVLAVLLIQAAAGEVVVFKNYMTKSTLGPGELHIEREIILQNVGSNPIIPGELHFKLHEVDKGEKVASKVSNLGARNVDINKELKSHMIEGKEETDLVVSVWEPVLPKFTYRVSLSYDLEFSPKGILFYEIKVPVEETTIPIKDNLQSLYLPSKYHVTYAPDATVTLEDIGNQKYRVVTWQNREEMIVEYSLIPLPKIGIRAVNVFWGVVIVSLLITTFLIHRRLRKV